MPKQLPDLYAELCARAQEPAPEGAHALYIAGRRCGWATHAACDALRDAPGVACDDTTLRIGQDLTPGAAPIGASLGRRLVGRPSKSALAGGGRASLVPISA